MELPVEVMEELEIIAMEATRGQRVGPGLLRGLERDIKGLFLRYGRDDLRVQAEVQGGGVVVHLLFERSPRRVQRVSLKLL